MVFILRKTLAQPCVRNACPAAGFSELISERTNCERTIRVNLQHAYGRHAWLHTVCLADRHKFKAAISLSCHNIPVRASDLINLARVRLHLLVEGKCLLTITYDENLKQG